jgi:hypothetical protein
VVLLLAGCGGSSNPLGTVRTAVSTTLAQTAQSTSRFSGSTAFGRTSEEVVAKGASILPRSLAFEQVDVQPVGGGIEYLELLPTVAYIAPSSASGTPFPPGKSIVSVPLTSAIDAVYPQAVAQLEGTSPQFLLDELDAGAVAARSTGHPVVNQEPFARYDVSVDLNRALAHVHGPAAVAERTAIGDELAALGSSRSKPVSFTVWVDGPGRVAAIKAPVPGSGLGDVSVFLAGFGNKLRSTPPPSAPVVSIRALPKPADPSRPLLQRFATSR